MKRLILLIVTILAFTGCGNDRDSYQQSRPVNTANYNVQAGPARYRQWWTSYDIKANGDVVFYRGFEKLRIDFYHGGITGDVWMFDRDEINEAWMYAKRELGYASSVRRSLSSILTPSWYSSNNYNRRHKTYRSTHPVVVVKKTIVKKDKKAAKKAKKLAKENKALKRKLAKEKKKAKIKNKPIKKKKKVLKPKKKPMKKKSRKKKRY